MNTITRLVLTGLAFTITACSSGGGDPAPRPVAPPTSPLPPPAPPAPPPQSGLDWVSCADQPSAADPSLDGPPQSPGGVWSGTLTNETRQTTYHFAATIGEDGRFHFYTHDARTG